MARRLTKLRKYVSRGSDWRKTAWNRWLVSLLEPDDEGPRPRDESVEARQPLSGARAQPPPARGADPRSSAPESIPPSSFGDPPGSTSPLSERQRLDVLTDRLEAAEQQLEALSYRLLSGDQTERRTTQRLSVLVERLTSAAEQQAVSSEATVAALERLDARITGLSERIAPRSVRPERYAPGATIPPLTAVSMTGTGTLPPPPRSGFSVSAIPPAPSPPPATLRPGESIAPAGPAVSGNLPDMSLATVLSLFELEKRTGVLTVRSKEGQALCLELYRGEVVGSVLDGDPVDPVQALREALNWYKGTFSYEDDDVSPNAPVRRSINSLLLQATCQMDEISAEAE